MLLDFSLILIRLCLLLRLLTLLVFELVDFILRRFRRILEGKFDSLVFFQKNSFDLLEREHGFVNLMNRLKQYIVLWHVRDRRNELGDDLKWLEGDLFVFEFGDLIVGFDDSSGEIGQRFIFIVLKSEDVLEGRHPMSCCLLTSGDLELVPDELDGLATFHILPNGLLHAT